MSNPAISIDDLMRHSGVGFGTSGARGRVEDMTDEVCYAYTAAFLQHLVDTEGLPADCPVAIGGDLRPSTPRIMAAVATAANDAGHHVVNCGYLPSPAIALYGIQNNIPAIMVTGSHIPDDRNGIKFNKPSGEILKADEAAIRARRVTIAADRFDASGMTLSSSALPCVSSAAIDAYIERYLDFFPSGCLAGLRLGLYEHSSVARDPLGAILRGLGAEVVSLGRSETFVPVDTEAVRPKDVELGKRWAAEFALDALISTDGDGDRPLVSDENGNWLRGDVAGILCARFLGADTVVTPVSSNTAAEKCGWFDRVVRTRIGSPFVIEGMMQASTMAGAQSIVGYEANGGFLTATVLERNGRRLAPLPTRDAVIVPLTLLVLARDAGGLSRLLAELPPRYTASDRIKAFPTTRSQERLSVLGPTEDPELARFEQQFGLLAGRPASADTTDGLRVTFENGEVVHLRASGNAPELRCYVETGDEGRSRELLAGCMAALNAWKAGTA